MKSPDEMLAQNQTPEAWLPLLELATREVFDIMLASKLDPLGDSAPPTSSDFTSMVGLAGKLCGLLTLRCSTSAATKMASRMLSVDPEEATDHIWDALGEVSNMIAGNFKNKLTGMGDGCMLSVPTVITGGDYSFHSLADGGSLEVMLKFDGEPITVNLELHT